jgi:hypothetical protein
VGKLVQFWVDCNSFEYYSQYLSTFNRHSSLNLQIILLVRDPRGVIQSRKTRPWCFNETGCHNPEILCQDMVDDYKESIKLTRTFPKSFK